MSRPSVTIHWFRRDLRLEDNTALHHALTGPGDVLPLFIFDTTILDRLEDQDDRRVDLIHRTLRSLKSRLEDRGGAFLVEHGEPLAVWAGILRHFDVRGVFANRDYEPYARERDRKVAALLQHHGIPFLTFKDQVLLEPRDVLKDDGQPYTVFTPYMKKWRSLVQPGQCTAFPSESSLDRLAKLPPLSFPPLEAIGFRKSDLGMPVLRMSPDVLHAYAVQRDRPDLPGTTCASTHLRFGLVSIRQLMRTAWPISEKLVNEFIWREFYMQILWHFPQVVGDAFRPEYDRIEWRADEEAFDCWREGLTGYPLVDAGMRELRATGLMHNRVRMVVASFLTKHLLIDWRWGEAHFARYLLDFELSSNNGNWQWASGSGCDAAPYFRVFNPRLQQERFDPLLNYVNHWLPEHRTARYVRPMIVHEAARDRAISTYCRALGHPMAKAGTVEQER